MANGASEQLVPRCEQALSNSFAQLFETSKNATPSGSVFDYGISCDSGGLLGPEQHTGQERAPSIVSGCVKLPPMMSSSPYQEEAVGGTQPSCTLIPTSEQPQPIERDGADSFMELEMSNPCHSIAHVESLTVEDSLQQTGDRTRRELLVTGYTHPEENLNCEGYVTAEQMDTTDQSAMLQQDIMKTDGLRVPQQKDLSPGNLVIGVSESAVDIMNPPLVSPDIIMEPNHFLEKGVGIVGESLNPVVSHVHNDARNQVSFRVRKKTRKHKTHEHCRMYMMEDIPVRDPSNYTECPEAFDGRYILKHMQTNAAHYASFLDIRRGSSQSLKTSIDVILGCIPRKQNRSLTTDGLVHTLFYMEGLLETFEEGLQSTGRYNLAAHVKEGIGELSYIRTSAERARRLSLEFTPQ